ncbi:MAG: mannitol dehydrogenase family protein, partial [Pseudomonadota bacterium]
WAIIGASVRPEDEAHRQRLLAQNCLSTLIELDPTHTSAEIVGSMIGFVPIEPGHRALIRQMADPAIRIVSMTVTEGGYFLNPATKSFDPSHEDIVHDAQALHAPRTAFGAILAALKIRRDANAGPFTCQSCDNLPGNGAILREVVIGLAKLADPGLAEWVEETVSFPNSMVDCIVPATGPGERALAESMGVADQAPVTHENFRQWVIEDDFCAGRPPLEKAGVTFSRSVHAFEAMKLRILNGGHQIIAAPGELLGCETIAETMQEAPIKALFRKVALREIAPHLHDIPGSSPSDYVDLVESRFANPAIHDTVRRVAFDGASRHTGAVLPVIRDAVALDAPFEGLMLSQALWSHMCAGTRENGSAIAPNDPLWESLTTAARAAQSDPQAWLAQREIYGALADVPRVRESFGKWLTRLHRIGIRQTLNSYLEH